MIPESDSGGYLPGHLLIAMPTMEDPRFSRAVIYMCAHNAEGAMGLVVNKELDSLSFSELLKQVGVDPPPADKEIRVHFGGPVETGRGFVLHSADYDQGGTLTVDDTFAVTASIDILRDIALGNGPDRSLLALGYAGWGPGQLETEIQANGWLHSSADPELVFATDLEAKWLRAVAALGIDPSMLAGEPGHA
ncbi:MAG: YqgE/AlgH family protein [Alphaproteobacteria bacterium]|nr:YqgE/AlgH family protein [Alphaproteobacteria bacterium]